MKTLIAAAALTVGMFALGTTAAEARPHHGHGWGHSSHHARHCVGWGHRHHSRYCRRWGW